MNKRYFILLMVLCLSLAGFGQRRISVNDFYQEFAYSRNAEKVGVGRFLMAVASPFIKKELRGCKLTGVQVISLEDCDQMTKDRFHQQLSLVSDNRYETFLKSNTSEEKTRILAKIVKDQVRELLIITSGDDPAIVRIKGRFSPEKVYEMVNRDEKIKN